MNDKETLQHEPPERDWDPESACHWGTHDWIYTHATAKDGTTFVRRKCAECGKVEWSEQ